MNERDDDNKDKFRHLRAIKVYKGKTPDEMDKYIAITNAVSGFVDNVQTLSYTFEMLTSGSRLRLPFTRDNIMAYPNVTHGGGMILCKN